MQILIYSGIRTYFLTRFGLYNFQKFYQWGQLYMHNPAKFLCMNFLMHDVIVKMKKGIINTKKKILIFLEARMCLPVIQSHAP